MPLPPVPRTLAPGQADREDDAIHGFIEVRGGREHNLRDVPVRIPRRAITGILGVLLVGLGLLALGR